MTNFKRILVANRGEIAVRIMRTCHEMGIETVAIYSEADRQARHVVLADQAVCVGPAPSVESYLDIDAILEAARRLHVDAVHPGYGFLAENADFADACINAGLVFIGPSPRTIRLMGSKIEARRTMEAHDVPVIPGHHGDDQHTDALVAAGTALGFPLLVKASAGGGGKGMRVVRSRENLPEILEAARKEAQSSFGDGTLLLERYIERPRHVEVQILGDTHGNLIHLFERECSIQRRYQKVIEETPSPALTPALREAMTRTALAVGQAIGYVNAGTVEFVLDREGNFYFLEVNTRLQVEHPVTEMVTGLDLVRLQIEVAEGRPLPVSQDDVVSRGHAIEARVYAEDPESGFLPSTGTIRTWQLAGGPGIRVDSGIAPGAEVSVHYDPLLAKVIAWADTREEAVRKLARTLRRSVIHGVTTNTGFLARLLDHPAFRAGAIDTHFIDTHFTTADSGTDRPTVEDFEALAAAALHQHLARWQSFPHLRTILPAFRNNRFRDQAVRFELAGNEVVVSYRPLGQGHYRVVAGPALLDILVLHFKPGTLRVEINRVVRTFYVTEENGLIHVTGPAATHRFRQIPDFPDADEEATPGTTVAPMPGRVLEVLVEEGQTVTEGTPLVTMEAMKMQHTIRAPIDGVVGGLFVHPGQLVDGGARIVSVVADP